MKFSDLMNLSDKDSNNSDISKLLSKLSFGLDKKSKIRLSYVPETSEFMSQEDQSGINSEIKKEPKGLLKKKKKTDKSESFLTAIASEEGASEIVEPETNNISDAVDNAFKSFESIVPFNKAKKTLNNRVTSLRPYYPTVRTGLTSIFNIASELGFEVYKEDTQQVWDAAAQIDRLYENQPEARKIVEENKFPTNFTVSLFYNDIDPRGIKENKKKTIYLVVYWSAYPVTNNDDFEVQSYVAG